MTRSGVSKRYESDWNVASSADRRGDELLQVRERVRDRALDEDLGSRRAVDVQRRRDLGLHPRAQDVEQTTRVIDVEVADQQRADGREWNAELRELLGRTVAHVDEDRLLRAVQQARGARDRPSCHHGSRPQTTGSPAHHTPRYGATRLPAGQPPSRAWTRVGSASRPRSDRSPAARRTHPAGGARDSDPTAHVGGPLDPVA
jgi:hypothetical protein